MDSKLGVQHGGHHSSHNGISKPPVHGHHAGRRAGSGTRQAGGGSGGGKGIKVVYISSPMKLIASAEEFRAIVQELTGRDSNVADHDLDGGAYYAGAPSSSYSSFGRVSPTAEAAVSPTMVAAAANAGPVRRAPEYAAAVAPPPPFQGMYDQTAGSLLYGQDYW